MSQTLQVLLCVVCKTFQVQIVKKSSNKWNCKICDSKQSVQQVYAKGTGAECRNIVQKLNEARGKREEGQYSKALASIAQADEQEACEQLSTESTHYFDEEEYTDAGEAHTGLQNRDNNTTKSAIPSIQPEKSKWAIFLEEG